MKTEQPTVRQFSQETADGPCRFVSVTTCAYSGATLLAFLLGSHPEIATVGEMDGLIPSEDPGKYRCSCGMPIRSCSFWRKVAAGMQEQGFGFDVSRFDLRFALPGSRLVQYARMGSSGSLAIDSLRDHLFHAWLPERRRVKSMVARNEAFIRSVLRVTGKRIFLDTSKDRLRLHAMARFSLFDLRAIHLVRDVRGVVASRLKRGVELPVSEMATQWVRHNQRFQTSVRGLLGDRYIQVRYEDLCERPAEVLKSLYRFCGCPEPQRNAECGLRIAEYGGPEPPSPPQPESVSQHIVGNPMRLESTRTVQPDEQWRRILSEQQEATIRQVAGRLSHALGYTL